MPAPPGEGKAGSSIGLANVQRRILLQYGAPYGLWWTARRAAAPVFRSRCPLGAGGKEDCHAARNNRGRRDPGAGHAGKNGGLGGRGFQLAGCYANGQAALEAMERCPADLVFTDIKMPVCSGLEFIDGVHALGLAPHIVVLSAFDEFPLVKQAFKKGAADYVLKQEIVPARMLELVREARAALCAGGDAPAPAPGAAPLRDTNAILQDVIFHNAAAGGTARAGAGLCCGLLLSG